MQKKGNKKSGRISINKHNIYIKESKKFMITKTGPGIYGIW